MAGGETGDGAAGDASEAGAGGAGAGALSTPGAASCALAGARQAKAIMTAAVATRPADTALDLLQPFGTLKEHVIMMSDHPPGLESVSGHK